MIITRGPDPGPFSQPRDYVTHLRHTFRSRCAYCLTHDDRLGGMEAMQVDHFRPESRHPEMRLAWSNLYYSCVICNNRKSHFPTPAESVRGERFVDPCNEDPDAHFALNREPETGDFCRVVSLSTAADYSIRRLQFNTRPFLRDYWRELDAAERLWTARRQTVAELLASIAAPSPEEAALLAQCDDKLAEIRARWPFPKQRSFAPND